MVTYRHFHFKTARNEHPVMVGAMLLHTSKGYSSYVQLPSNMVKHCPSLINVLDVGTDSEKNVYQPFLDILKDPVHLFCNIHMGDNVYNKAVEYQVPKEDSSKIMAEIFGPRVGDIVLKGVVDAEG